MTAVAQVEALGPLENNFLKVVTTCRHSGSTWSRCPWPGVFPAVEDDLDLGLSHCQSSPSPD